LLVVSPSKVNPVIPLKWKEETLNLINENNMMSLEMNTVDQSLNNQINMEKNESIRGISTRNKKARSTVTKDF
jgi:hypothetical protein